jgi:hypothetical protein
MEVPENVDARCSIGCAAARSEVRAVALGFRGQRGNTQGSHARAHRPGGCGRYQPGFRVRTTRSVGWDTRVVGEIDPQGTRKGGLDAFLEQKVKEGYAIETRTDTHAILFRRPKGLRRFTSGADPGRYVVEVDEDGIATMRPAEPRRN